MLVLRPAWRTVIPSSGRFAASCASPSEAEMPTSQYIAHSDDFLNWLIFFGRA